MSENELNNLANTALSLVKNLKAEMSKAPVKSINLTWVVSGQDDQILVLPEINIQFDTVGQ